MYFEHMGRPKMGGPICDDGRDLIAMIDCL